MLVSGDSGVEVIYGAAILTFGFVRAFMASNKDREFRISRLRIPPLTERNEGQFEADRWAIGAKFA